MKALYPNDTQSNIGTDSTITTSFILSNSSRPTAFSRPPSTPFTEAHQSVLNQLQISNASAEFFATLYWAINLDLGQFSSQNIFTNANLLADSTDIFHDNVFINDTFQDTPLSDGNIPGDGYRAFINSTLPPIQTAAYINAIYQCYKWIRKPFLLALIDIVVPSVVLLALILGIGYLLSLLCSGKRPGIL
jgi:hypothetical protein